MVVVFFYLLSNGLARNRNTSRSDPCPANGMNGWRGPSLASAASGWRHDLQFSSKTTSPVARPRVAFFDGALFRLPRLAAVEFPPSSPLFSVHFFFFFAFFSSQQWRMRQLTCWTVSANSTHFIRLVARLLETVFESENFRAITKWHQFSSSTFDFLTP